MFKSAQMAFIWGVMVAASAPAQTESEKKTKAPVNRTADASAVDKRLEGEQARKLGVDTIVKFERELAQVQRQLRALQSRGRHKESIGVSRKWSN